VQLERGEGGAVNAVASGAAADNHNEIAGRRDGTRERAPNSQRSVQRF
jgi:hypothetical protein